VIGSGSALEVVCSSAATSEVPTAAALDLVVAAAAAPCVPAVAALHLQPPATLGFSDP
jgi:hypothetical protein